MSSACDKFGNNPHPARGRKLERHVAVVGDRRKQPTPRKGTETSSRRSLGNNAWETTHTPQGDGNVVISTSSLPSRETTHTPQGDGNKPSIISSFNLLRNNPHPARGRKHHSNTTSRAPCYRNNPHPARGRKLIRAYHFTTPLLKQPTPRKGTETASGSRSCPHPLRNNPHPARGRKQSDVDLFHGVV